MIEWELDTNNDIGIKNGSFGTVIGTPQVGQHVRTRLLFYLGEWFLDSRAGTPWFQEVFRKGVNLPTIENIIKSRIANTPELDSITQFAMELPDPRTRILSIQFTALTEDNQELTQEISVP